MILNNKLTKILRLTLRLIEQIAIVSMQLNGLCYRLIIQVFSNDCG